MHVVGETFYRDGEIITIRDVAMKRVIDEGAPEEIIGKPAYIAGPIIKNHEVISCGPTTATRVEPFIYDYVKIARPPFIIGKGPMYENMERAARDFDVFYAIFPGGCGALAAKSLRVIGNIRPELGMPESIWIMKAEHFGPLFVAIDKNRNLLKEVEERAKRIFEGMFL